MTRQYDSAAHRTAARARHVSVALGMASPKKGGRPAEKWPVCERVRCQSQPRKLFAGDACPACAEAAVTVTPVGLGCVGCGWECRRAASA